MVEQIKNVNVALGPIEEFSSFGGDVSDYSSVFILVDENTNLHCLPIFREVLDVPFNLIEIKSGEENKNLLTCEKVWGGLLKKGADRRSLVINLGGGVVGDLGGFCAATFMRGMDFIQVPTTVLAMADASVGGKVGVDFRHMKNYVGLFRQPELVWIDPIFIKTLSDRQVNNGLAEVVKHGFIANPAILDELEKENSQIDWMTLLSQSVKVKAEIVEADTFEKGERKKLNFGHTIGHAIESIFLEDRKDLLHGEAIAMGMLAATWISHQQTGLPESEMLHVEKLLTNRYEHLDLRGISSDRVLEKVRQDKKSIGGNVGFTLLRNIGSAVVEQKVEEEMVIKSIEYYNNL